VRRSRHGTALFLAVIAAAIGAPALAEENPALVEALTIMRDRGMIDEAKYTELVEKDQQWEASHAAPSLLSRIEWFGDFRTRLENFWYEKDPFGVDTPDNSRGRYRLRFGGKVKINDVVTTGFRLTSADPNQFRSENRSFGSDQNFDYDPIFIDLAWVELAVPKRFLPEGMTLKATTGKQLNPFLWKNGKDIMIWDNDITPEGVSVQMTALPAERLSMFFNGGYFISNQNNSMSDPHVLGLQGGLGYAPFEKVDTGLRVSWYSWASQVGSFVTSEQSFGNLVPNNFNVVETSGYVRLNQIENWPILINAQFAQNVDAKDIGGAGKQDIGWNAGLEIGDKKKYVLFGGGYYREEANFSVSQFTDSDLLDGFTNRKGWLVYLQRTLFANTDLQVTLFADDPIETGAAFAIPGNTTSSDRYRLQTDLTVTF